MTAARLKSMRKYNRLRRDRFWALGLTSRGRPRKQRVWSTTQINGKCVKGDRLAQQRIKRAEFVAKGLTADGTMRKYRQWPQLKDMHGRDRDNARNRLRYRERHPRQARNGFERWQQFRQTLNIVRPTAIDIWLEKEAA